MGIIKLLNPASSQKFFEEMEPKGFGSNLRYLMILGIFTLIGHFLLNSVIGIHIEIPLGIITQSEIIMYSVTDGAILALLAYSKAVMLPILSAICFSLVWPYMFNKKIALREIMTVIAYVETPVLILGIFMAFSMTGIFIVATVGELFSVFLFYFAFKSRFVDSQIDSRSRYLKGVVLFVILSLCLTYALDAILISVTPEMKTFDEFTWDSEDSIVSQISDSIEEAEKKNSPQKRGIGEWGEQDEEGYQECALETDSESKDLCYVNIAFDNPKPCEAVVDSGWRDGCYEEVAFVTLEYYLCDEIQDIENRNECFAEVAYELEDISVCNKISDPYDKKDCIEDIL